jgi:hypothetical protein
MFRGGRRAAEKDGWISSRLPGFFEGSREGVAFSLSFIEGVRIV